MKKQLILLALSLWAAQCSAAPTVFWASDPVRPDETVMVQGGDLADATWVAVERVPDTAKRLAVSARAERVKPIQVSDVSLKFVLPASLKMGVYAFKVVTPAGAAAPVALNRPQAWWAQGDLGTDASPGGWIRVFGKCLSLTEHSKARVELVGPKRQTLAGETTPWQARVEIPKNLPTGEYRLRVHHGNGGELGWSEAVTLRVRQPEPWPQTIFSVKEYGADATGRADASVAIKDALAAAEKNGGGIVFLPRGRYSVKEMLEIPRFTVLRGEKADRTCIFWPDMQEPPEALLKGTNSFGMEDFTVYCSHYKNVISSDLSKPDSGDTFLRRVRVRADRYRGHLKSSEVDERMRAVRFGGDTIQLSGANVEITDCDIYGSGRALYLLRVRKARITGNTFYNGRHGWYCIDGSDGLIFEKNQIIGADLMATGGSLNCYSSGYSQNIYYAHNQLSLMHGWDREAMTSDAGGGAYYGTAKMTAPTALTLDADARWGGRQWEGAVVFIVDGKGEGQYRRIVKWSGREVEIDRKWDIPPDETSLFSATMLQHHYLLVGNDFSDAGISAQFYGTSVDHIIADNRCVRAGGYQSIGKLYAGSYKVPPEQNFGHQPSMYLQYLNNEIAEGNIYRSGANNSILSGESVIGVLGYAPKGDWKWPYNVGTVVRGNRLLNNAFVHIGGSPNTLPTVRDVVVENNLITHADEGVRVDMAAAGVVLRGNRFEDVARPLTGSGIGNAVISPEDRVSATRARVAAVLRNAGVPESPSVFGDLEAVLSALRAAPVGSPEWQKAETELTTALLAEIARHRKEVPLGALASLIDAQATVEPESTLPALLETGKGGEASLLIAVSADGVLPEGTAELSLSLPRGWKALRQAAPVAFGRAMRFDTQVQVPDGAWGRQALGLAYQLKFANTTLSATSALSVGTAFIREWMMVGPFPNKDKSSLDLTIRPPEGGIDLKATYDGPHGKMAWQPVHLRGNWMDLRQLLKTKEPGVTYAAACVRADAETPVVLELGSSAGVALLLNGQYVWSSDASRKAAANQEQAPVILQAGDNVLLFKLTGVGDEWKFAAEIAPPPGGFKGRLQIVPPEQFASLKAFAPPPPRPQAGMQGELKYTGGVAWKLVYADDFGSDALSSRWRQAVGKWKQAGGMLLSEGGQCFLSYGERVKAPVRIEYDARAQGKDVGDMSAFWLSDPSSYASGYLFGIGSNGGAANKVLIEGGGDITSSRAVPVAGKWHHVIAQVLPTGRAQIIVDGQLSLDHQGPLLTDKAYFPGLWAWGAVSAFDNARVFTAGD